MPLKGQVKMQSTYINGELVTVGDSINLTSAIAKNNLTVTLVKIFEEVDEVMLRLDNGVSEVNIPASDLMVK